MTIMVISAWEEGGTGDTKAPFISTDNKKRVYEKIPTVAIRKIQRERSDTRNRERHADNIMIETTTKTKNTDRYQTCTHCKTKKKTREFDHESHRGKRRENESNMATWACEHGKQQKTGRAQRNIQKDMSELD